MEKIEPGLTDRPIPLVSRTPEGTKRDQSQEKKNGQKKPEKQRSDFSDELEETVQQEQSDNSENSDQKGTRIDVQA